MQKEQQKTIDYSQYKERNSFAFWTLILILFVLGMRNLKLFEASLIFKIFRISLGEFIINSDYHFCFEIGKWFGKYGVDKHC